MLTAVSSLEQLRASTATVRRQIEEHGLYREIRTVPDLQLFMQLHVFAVWDFMSLLKSLQRRLTSVSIPWVPSLYPNSRRLINEIVLSEESDLYGNTCLSHFELYLEAMREAGADTGPIEQFLRGLQNGETLEEALAACSIPQAAQDFILSTFETIRLDTPHTIAAAFTFGREDLIPDMFREIVRELPSARERTEIFAYYLDRHIQLDGESHGALALAMLDELCADDDRRWFEAAEAAKCALEARLRLWNAILGQVLQSRAGRSSATG